jgi:hypothetical protein
MATLGSILFKPAARAHNRWQARWSILARRAPSIAGSHSVRKGKVRRFRLHGKPHGPQVRTGHMSRSSSSTRRLVRMMVGLRPDSCLGSELTHPTHSLGGRVGMVAELLRHLSNAATNADLLHGVVDCLGHHVGGGGV